MWNKRKLNMMIALAMMFCVIGSSLGNLKVEAVAKMLGQVQAVKMLVKKVPYEKQTKFKCTIVNLDSKTFGNQYPKVMIGKTFYMLEDDFAEDVPPVYYIDATNGRLILICRDETYSQISPERKSDLKITKQQAVQAAEKHIGNKLSRFNKIKANQVELIEYTNQLGKCYSVYAIEKRNKLKHYFDVNVYSGKVYDSFNEP